MATKAKTETEKKPRLVETKPTPEKWQRHEGVFYLVNPSGAIHGVDRDHAKWRLAMPGWRLATEEEVTAYHANPVQRSDRPICPKWSPDPDKQLAELE